jgi:pyruvate dehydrogenase E2 component (dihydrolipoamide acetyltransferase)
LKATAAALRTHPRLNSSYRDGRIEEHSRVNIGFLVETGDAPVVPTLPDADGASVEHLREQTARLAAGARAGSITAPDLAAATFTVARLEGPASGYAAPIVPGQAGLLAVASPREREAQLTLACDARIVLAPEAAAFLATVVENLEPGSPG